MTFTDDELSEIIETVTIALGELLLNHRQLTEAFYEDNQITLSQDKIEKQQEEIEKQRDRIQKTKDAVRRRKKLEKISAQHEKDSKSSPAKPPQTETVTKPSRFETILDQRGQVVGFVQKLGNQTVYLDAKLKVVARENGNKTYDRRGLFAGYGRQGLRLIGQSSKVGNI